MMSASRGDDFCAVWAAATNGNADPMAIAATAARYLVLLRILHTQVAAGISKRPSADSFDLGQFGRRRKRAILAMKIGFALRSPLVFATTKWSSWPVRAASIEHESYQPYSSPAYEVGASAVRPKRGSRRARVVLPFRSGPWKGRGGRRRRCGHNRMDDEDNRLFGITAQIAWTPKPSYQLTLRTPLYAIKN